MNKGRFAWLTAVAFLAAAALAGATPASEGPNEGAAPPARIDFPAGWAAEGIWIGHGTFYAGNTQNGAIYRGDVRTGTGSVLVPGQTGRSAFGVFVDKRNRIFVAGGRTGHAYVYDATSGAQIADVTLVPAPAVSFINDVVVTRTGAYFTNTSGPTLHRIPIGKHGELGAPETIPVPFGGGNGIEATPDGKTLVIVSITLNKLYAFDTTTNVTREIILNDPIKRGDGLILDGRTLYAAENLPSTAFPGATGDVAVVQLARDFNTGTLVARLNNPDDPLVNPATIDLFGSWIYVVRRDQPAPVPAAYHLTRVTIPQTDEQGDHQHDGSE